MLLDPAGRPGKPPELPSGREWPAPTVQAWNDLWATPQATMWDQTGRTLRRWAWLHAELTERRQAAAALSAEMRQIEDRHGLSPKALMTLRWRIGTGDEAPERPKRPTTRRPRLRVVDQK